MTGLLHAHSGLRYVVLLLALVNLVVLLKGLAAKSTPGKLERALGSAYVGTLHLQVLLGIVMLFQGAYYPRLMGHIVLMAAATLLAQVMSSLNKRRPQPGHQLPLVGVVGSLLLIVGGAFAIGKNPLLMSVGG